MWWKTSCLLLLLEDCVEEAHLHGMDITPSFCSLSVPALLVDTTCTAAAMTQSPSIPSMKATAN